MSEKTLPERLEHAARALEEYGMAGGLSRTDAATMEDGG